MELKVIEEEDKEEEEVKCLICDKEPSHPVYTLCQHLFCESCAMMHNAKHKGCFECGKPT